MVKEGYWYASPLVTMAGGLVLLRLYWAASAVLILAIFVLNFFRDPERLISSDPDAIVCPADGRVVEIREESYDGRTVRRVSIFMSPLDVHVNRSPIAGVIEGVRYQKGAFHVASEARASVENEMNVFAVRGSQGVVVVKQIAGVLARRIVFWKKAGAKPKVMTSARESNSRPKFELALVMRAMRPSRPSKRIAQPMARAAASKDVIE